MSSTMTKTDAPTRMRSALPALWVGLALTVLVGVYALIDDTTTRVLAEHIQRTYPSFGAQEVAAGVQAYVAILLVVTLLGAIAWLTTIWAARSGKTWTRWLATTWLVAAVGIALAGLTTVDTSGEVGLAPLMGWLMLVPTLPGIVAVVTLWRRRDRM